MFDQVNPKPMVHFTSSTFPRFRPLSSFPLSIYYHLLLLLVTKNSLSLIFLKLIEKFPHKQAYTYRSCLKMLFLVSPRPLDQPSS